MFIYELVCTAGLDGPWTERHSTLLSANRAAYLEHSRLLGLPIAGSQTLPDLQPLERVQMDFRTELYDGMGIEVRRVKINGPDLMNGEVDVEDGVWMEENASLLGIEGRKVVEARESSPPVAAVAPSKEQEGDDDSDIEIIEGPALKKIKLASGSSSAPSKPARTRQTARKSTGGTSPTRCLDVNWCLVDYFFLRRQGPANAAGFH